ncbi:MAG TPA: DUF4331 domain-containing protein [Chloroflexota bacterium]|nr:DUF4331 domain-containing protein [Chloroflexota bacterium]
MPRLTVGQAVAAMAAAVAVPVAALSLALAPTPQDVGASSHREAPLISQDPAADGTDFYMFTSPEDNGTVTLVANYYPMTLPQAGPNFYRFGDDVMYAIKLDNNGDNKADITYELRFKTNIRNNNTFLYNTNAITSIDDPDLNVYQTYTVTRVDGAGRREIAKDQPVAPWNIGPRSYPEGYDKVAAQAVRKLDTGGQVFAGPRDDPFFVDFSLFDLLGIRKLPGNMGGGVDGLQGFNVMTIALQIPTNQLSANGQAINKGDLGNSNAVIGGWTTSSRQKTMVINDLNARAGSGDWVQVSRLGMPLVNEVVLPLKLKDAFNSISPDMDVAAGALPYVQRPEVEGLLKALYGLKVPERDRADLVAIFLTGVPGSVLGLPGATAPMNVPSGASTGSEMMRLNMGTPPTKIGEGNRLGAVGGDVLGYPNGRRLADDVVDISVKAVAGATLPLVDPSYSPDPLAAQLGDGVDMNDRAFLPAFPYLAAPHEGFKAFFTQPFPFVRCGTGKVFHLNPDGSLGRYVGQPSEIGGAPVLQQSGSVSADQIRSVCGSN